MKAHRYIIITFLFLQMLKPNHTIAQILDTVCANVHGEVYRVKPTPGSKYYWSVVGGAITSENPNDSVVVDWPGKQGVYTITVTEITKNGCPGVPIIGKVLVIDRLRVNLEGPKVICKGEPITLIASGANHYRWSNGQTGAVIHVKPNDSTTYTVIGYDGQCTPDSASIRVKVLPKPTAAFTFTPKSPIVDEKVYFHYMGKGADNWSWYFDNEKGPGDRIVDIDYIFREPGEKDIMLVSKNKAGCTDTSRYHLMVRFEAKIFVPKAFTPNGDGLNEGFKAVCMGIDKLHMTIFNRWGEQVYETDDLNAAWDGTFKGVVSQEGVFLYVIKAQDNGKNWHYLKGTVTLLR